MKKIKLIAVLVSFTLMSFKAGLKLATGAVVLKSITNEAKAQTPITKEEADAWYKPIGYTPTITAIDGTTPYLRVDGLYDYENNVYTWNMVQTKPDFVSVAFSGSYYDIIYTPTIPLLAYGFYNNSNEYSVDTSAVHGIMSKDRANGAISNMMTIINSKMSNTVTIPTNNNQLSNGSGYLTSEVDGSITNEIQTVSGSGTKTLSLSNSGGTYIVPNITSGEVTTALGFTPATNGGTLSTSQVTTALGGVPLTSETQSLSISGNTISIKSGTTTINTIILPIDKRRETYSGTSNGSGIYTITFSTAYSVAPNIQASWIGAADTQNLRVTAVSTTGFSVLARNRTDVVGLLPSWSNVSGAAIDVLITEK